MVVAGRQVVGVPPRPAVLELSHLQSERRWRSEERAQPAQRAPKGLLRASGGAGPRCSHPVPAAPPFPRFFPPCPTLQSFSKNCCINNLAF